MSNLTRFQNNGIELIIDTSNGESFATISGYARMAKKAQSTISERVSKDHRCNEVKTAKIQTAGGLQGVRLIPESLIKQWIKKDNPELADRMMDTGLRVFLHGIAGFKYKAELDLSPEEQALTLAKALLASHEENLKLKAKIKVDKPKVEFAEAVQGSEGAIDFNKFAKSIGMGRNTMMAQLRTMDILMKDSVLPYQKYCDRGYFEVSEKVLKNKEVVHYALVTGKGQLWLQNRINSFDN